MGKDEAPEPGAQLLERSPTGQFLPGHSVRPLDRTRPLGKNAMASAAAAVATEAEFIEYIRQALRIASASGSARQLITVLEFIRDTAYGKPGVVPGQGDGEYVDIIAVVQSIADRR